MRRRACRAIVAVGALGLSFFTSRAIAADEFLILNGFEAKEGCSCVFVAEQSDDYCTTFAHSASSLTPTVTIDHNAKTVTSVLSDTRVARFVDGAGCTLDPL